jgi:hypothetical protein
MYVRRSGRSGSASWISRVRIAIRSWPVSAGSSNIESCIGELAGSPGPDLNPSMPVRKKLKSLSSPSETRLRPREKANKTKTPVESNTMNVTRSQRATSSVASPKKPAQQKAPLNSGAKSKSQKNVSAQPSNEQVALRAYFIAERRRTLGIDGDETSDWVAAERELLEELKAK